MSVKAGQHVNWTDQSGHHTVTFERDVNGNGTAPDSGDVGPGQSFPLTFPTPGTYQYRCRYHSSDFGPGKGMTAGRSPFWMRLSTSRSQHILGS